MSMKESRARLRALLMLPDPQAPAASAFPRSMITRLAITLLPVVPRVVTLFMRRRRARRESPWPVLARTVIEAFGARVR